MKIYDTVKTEEKAKEIIDNYTWDNVLEEGFLKMSSCQCECGKTQCLTWYNGDVSLSVAICDSCGDDDANIDEVLEVR